MSDRPAPRGRWLALVLLASLAVNCLLAGVMFGTRIAGPALRDQPPVAAPLGGGAFGQHVGQSCRTPNGASSCWPCGPIARASGRRAWP